MSEPPSYGLSRTAEADRRLGKGALALACALAAGTTIHLCLSPYIDWSLLLYPAALLLGWCGEGWLHGERPSWRLRQGSDAIQAHRVELALLALIVLGGTGMRIWLIHQYPFLHGAVSDEPNVGGLAWNLIHGTQPWPLYQLMGGAVGLIQPVAAMFLLFGANIASFRALAPVQTALIITTFYMLARQFTRTPAALCATTLLAFAYWPTMMGSLAFGWMNGIIFQSLGLVLLLQGLQRRSVAVCAAGGGVLALCLYSYLGHRIILLAIVPFLCTYLGWGGGRLRSRLLLLGSFLFGLAVIAIPWITIVARDHYLLVGDSEDLGAQFQQALHQNAPDAMHTALVNAAHLSQTILISPRTSSFGTLSLAHGGLLDPLTACLVALGLGYALIRFWRPENVLLIWAVVLPLASASIVVSDFVDTYRLNSIIAALFLAIALVLDRCYRLCKSATMTRMGLAALVIIAGWGTTANLRAVTAQVTNCAAMTGSGGLLSADDAESIALVDQVNSLDARYAVFVVSHSLQEWVWLWLFKGGAPPEYNPLSADTTNPVQWKPLYGTTPSGEQFWPPKIASGQIAVTYFITDQDSSIFLPIIERAYPGGRLVAVRTRECPTFTIFSYTLTARQLAAGIRPR